ncbi:MAG: glycosyltransferase family 4 protein [Candidatus Levyibacteriota bacterium]
MINKITKKVKVCMVVGNPFTHDARVTKESQSLSKAGYDVTVYATERKDLPRHEKVGEIKIKRLKGRYSPIRFNLYRIPTQLIPSIFSLVRERADIYHAHDLDTLFSCAVAARLNKSKLVYDSHELYLEMIKSHRVEVFGKQINDSAVLMFLYGLIEKAFINRADAVITVSDPLREILADRYGLKRITVIMNCPPKPSYTKSNKKFHKFFSLPKDAKVILYQGALSSERGLNYLVSSIKYLPKDFYLVFMGDGAVAKSSESTQRVKFLPAVQLKELPYYTASADIGVVQLLNNSLNNFYGLPNKIFEYMSVGLPVAAVNFPNLKKVVEETGAGTLFDGEDPKDIARAINEILSDPKKRKKMGLNALKASREKYNWEIEEKKLLKIYKEL